MARGSLLRFWFKCVTRILPAYWACLAIVAIGLTIAGAWPKGGVDFLAHVVMLQDYPGSVFVPAFWSLGAEEKFYLLAADAHARTCLAGGWFVRAPAAADHVGRRGLERSGQRRVVRRVLSALSQSLRPDVRVVVLGFAIAIAPALIGLGFGAMVIAAVAVAGSYSIRRSEGGLAGARSMSTFAWNAGERCSAVARGARRLSPHFGYLHR